YFQVAVELESPANIWEMDLWNVEGAAEDGSSEQPGPFESAQTQKEDESADSSANELHEMPFIPGEPIEKAMDDTARAALEAAIETPSEYSPLAAESPLLRELSAELRRQAKEAVDSEASETAQRMRTNFREIERQRHETER